MLLSLIPENQRFHSFIDSVGVSMFNANVWTSCLAGMFISLSTKQSLFEDLVDLFY